MPHYIVCFWSEKFGGDSRCAFYLYGCSCLLLTGQVLRTDAGTDCAGAGATHKVAELDGLRGRQPAAAGAAHRAPPICQHNGLQEGIVAPSEIVKHKTCGPASIRCRAVEVVPSASS